MKRWKMVVALAVMTGSAAVVTPVAPSVAGGASPGGPPDTFVAAWDAVGTQAFSAAALTPAEGHTIFGYVAVAVYDAVMAIEGVPSTRVIATLLYGVGASDPTVLAVVVVSLVVVALIASALPAWRASRVDPVIALRDG